MEAVRAAEEFFTAGGPERNFPSRAMPVDMEGEMPEPTAQMHQAMTSFAQVLQGQSALLARLVERLDDRQSPKAAPLGAQQVQCFQCGGPHMKRHCPESRRPAQARGAPNNYNHVSPVPKARSGNAQGPAQA